MRYMDVDFECFETVCRTCAKRNAEFSIFRKSKRLAIEISDMLIYCTSVEVHKNDKLPTRICQKCVTRLREFYNFKKHVIETTEFLSKMLLQKQLEQYSALNMVEKVGEEVLNVNTVEENKKIKTDVDFESDFFSNESLPLDRIENKTGDTREDQLSNLLNEKDFRISNSNINTEKKETPNSKKRKHLKGRVQCESCGKILSCKSNLNQHMKSHSGEKPYSCEVCEKKFKRLEHLTVHKRIHTGERPYVCPTCKKTFIQQASLTAHIRIHTGEKSHTCAICGKCFSQAASLIYHTRSHTGETPHTCKVCNKGFTHRGNLKIHMRFHVNERPYVCDICKKGFHTTSHLSTHMAQHTGCKPHQCVACGKAFVRNEHLKIHLLIHTGQKPHACSKCPKRYAQRSHLNRHLKTHVAE